MSSVEEFEANLARGTAGEDLVYGWLKNNYSYVQDMRAQTRETGTGPRLGGRGGSVILPDFAVYDKFKGRKLNDVKTKSSVYPINGKRYFTVDDYKFHDYQRCVSLMGYDGLMLIFVFEGKFFLYESSEHKGVHRFNNTFGKQAYLFEYDESKIRY